MLQEEETVRDLYKRIHRDDANLILQSVRTSDVLVLNRNGEITCYYVDQERLFPICNFVQLSGGGNVINLDTKDYEIAGKSGKWDSKDELIIDGSFFYLLESQKYRGDASAVILDSYGKLIADDVTHGFDEETKQCLS